MSTINIHKFRKNLNGVNDGLRLSMLNDVYEHNDHSALTQYQTIKKACEVLAEDGQIAIVWSGMDCDCSTYRRVHTVPATVKDVVKDIEHTYYWADGPCSWVLERLSKAYDDGFQSRDLILEAFEDGHPHCVTY